MNTKLFGLFIALLVCRSNAGVSGWDAGDDEVFDYKY